jgi:hypothetical protein
MHIVSTVTQPFARNKSITHKTNKNDKKINEYKKSNNSKLNTELDNEYSVSYW